MRGGLLFRSCHIGLPSRHVFRARCSILIHARCFSSSWRNRADALVAEASKRVSEEKTDDAEALLYEALRVHLQNNAQLDQSNGRDAFDLMRHITIFHLARFGADQDVAQLEKARVMQQKTEEALETVGDWSGLVEAIIRRGRQNEALFQSSQEEERLAAAEEAFRLAVGLAEKHALRGEIAVVARLYLAQRLSERSEIEEHLDKEAIALLKSAAEHVREHAKSAEKMEMLATINLARGRHEMRLTRYRESEPIFESTMKMLSSVAEPSHPLLLESKSLFMHTLLLNDKRDAAIILAGELLKLNECGAPQMADILNMCSVVFFSGGDEKSALKSIDLARKLKEANGEDTSALDETLRQFEIVKQGEREEK